MRACASTNFSQTWGHCVVPIGPSLGYAAGCSPLLAGIGVETMLSRFDTIRISESAHGPAGARTYKYVPAYLSRSHRRLHLELTSVSSNGPA